MAEGLDVVETDRGFAEMGVESVEGVFVEEGGFADRRGTDEDGFGAEVVGLLRGEQLEFVFHVG